MTVQTRTRTHLSPRRDFLDGEVSDFMTPGVVTISEDTPVEAVSRSLAAHGVHAILVIGADGQPLGWVTANGLLRFLGRDRLLATARDAITEKVTGIEPSAGIRSALYALSLPGVDRLVVRRGGVGAPEGVLTEFDLAALAEY